MITIVTSRTYLLCEGLNSITLQFNPDQMRNGRWIPYYDIHINFIPQSRGNNNNSSSRSNDEDHVLSVRVAGEEVALATFKEIVSQLREQLPDQAYLDKMLDNILSGAKDIHDEPGPTKISGLREKKRRSKKVLRRTRKRSRRPKR